MKFVLEQSEARDGKVKSLLSHQVSLKLALFKVYYTVTIDGKQIHRVENKQPRTFTDVKIFAGPSTNVADGNYRNLVYETIPKKELYVKIEWIKTIFPRSQIYFPSIIWSFLIPHLSVIIESIIF